MKESNSTPNMFFIVGMTRSGTTLLRLICNHHSNMVCLPESKFMLALKRKFLYKKLVPTDAAKIIARLKNDRKIVNRWQLDFVQLEQDMRSTIAAGGNFAEVCRLVYMHAARKQQKQILLLGDKNPAYALETGWLARTFPQARFVHLVRDYRDCVASNRKTFKKQAVGILGLSWNQHQQAVEKSKQLFPERFWTLRYEDLVRNPEAEVKHLCEFLGIPFEPQQLQFHLHNQAKNVDLSKPVHSGNIGKYKKSLSPQQVNWLDYLCAQTGKKYGYIPELKTRVKIYYPLVKEWAKMRLGFSNVLTRWYYKSPFFLQKAAGRMSDFLFRAFKITSSRNHSEMKYKQRKSG